MAYKKLRDNKGCFVKGHINISSGQPKGIHNSLETEFKVGSIPWNKSGKNIFCKHCGKEFYIRPCRYNTAKYCSRSCIRKNQKLSEETKLKISLANKGRLNHIPMKGENHYNWKGGLTTPNRSERMKFRYLLLKKIYERDNYTCQICHKRGCRLHIDHIKGWAKYPELRFQEDNCRTLCEDCHFEVTFNKTKPKNLTWGGNYNV